MGKSSSEFYIGVDSGGTKCELIIITPDKKILHNKTYKGVHYSVSGNELYSEAISGYIISLVSGSDLSLQNCLGICLGVAGAREDKDRKNLRSSFMRKLKMKEIIVTTDAMTALYGAFEGKDGIILISGTGSVLYGYTGGRLIRIGGWGRIIGDEGSGYWIGRRALNLVTKEFDETKSNSLLSISLLKKFGISKVNANEKVFNDKFEIQKIAPVVIECAEKKCRVSLQIVNEAVEELLRHILIFLKVSGINESIQIAFVGSVIENNNILSKRLRSQIKKLKTVRVVPKKHSSSYGAVLLSMENSEITHKL